MTDKEKTIRELKEALDSLDITNKYRLNLIRAIEYLQEEPVSKIIFDGNFNKSWYAHPELAFKAGAKWQYEQFEKNRLAACDKQTKEEAEIEMDFVTSILEKEHRQPTYNDAIKYGMKLKEQQMINNAIDATIGYYNHCGLSIDVKLPKDLKEDSKCKILIIKDE